MQGTRDKALIIVGGGGGSSKGFWRGCMVFRGTGGGSVVADRVLRADYRKLTVNFGGSFEYLRGLGGIR